jgi:hypothetical protein
MRVTTSSLNPNVSLLRRSLKPFEGLINTSIHGKTFKSAGGGSSPPCLLREICSGECFADWSSPLSSSNYQLFSETMLRKRFIRFTPLESPIIYGRDDIDKILIPYSTERVELKPHPF